MRSDDSSATASRSDDSSATASRSGAGDRVAGPAGLRTSPDPATTQAVEPCALRQVPDATVGRLAVYLRALSGLTDEARTTVSSEELARAAGVNPAKLRKDLSYLGSYGTRGVGYEVDTLIEQIAHALGLSTHRAVALIGVGNLGRALADYGGFASRGFRMVALFDADPARIGSSVAGFRVHAMSDLHSVVTAEEVSIGVIATPAHAAQTVCDALVSAGVTSILNFAPTVLRVPAAVDVRKVDLAIELQILSFHAHRKSGARPLAVIG